MTVCFSYRLSCKMMWTLAPVRFELREHMIKLDWWTEGYIILYNILQKAFSIFLANHYLFAEFDSAELLWAIGASTQICLCALLSQHMRSQCQQSSAGGSATEPAPQGWCGQLCPASSRRKAVSAQQRELKAAAGESHARFLRFYANWKRLGRSVKISVLADTLCGTIIYINIPNTWGLAYLCI